MKKSILRLLSFSGLLKIFSFLIIITILPSCAGLAGIIGGGGIAIGADIGRKKLEKVLDKAEKKIDKVLQNVGVQRESVEATIDDAVIELSANSGNWQTILNKTISKIDNKHRELKNDIQLLIERGIAHAGIEVRCNITFLNDMLVQGLQRIKADFLGNPIPEIIPFICSTSPSFMDMNLSKNQRNSVELFGYNLDQGKTDIFHVKVQDGVEQKIKSNRSLSIISPFHGVINLGANGIILAKESQRIEIHLGSAKVLSIPVVQKHLEICQEAIQLVGQERIKVILREKDLVIPAGGGDYEFYRNGPCIIAKVGLRLNQNRTKLFATISVIASECNKDWSRRGNPWTGARRKVTVELYTVEPGWEISQILSESYKKLLYRDNSLHIDTVEDAGLVREWVILGDTSGDDIGETFVEVALNPTKILLREVGNCALKSGI